MRAADNMKLLQERRDRLRSEFEAAKARLDEIEHILRMMRGEPTEPIEEPKVRRGSVKQTVIDLITQSAETGLSVIECIETAKAKMGQDLDRGTVSSLLSRYKRDGVVIFDGTRYRLKQYAGPREAA